MSSMQRLLSSALAGIDDSPPLAVTRKLKDRRDQGITLVERALLGKLTQELKQQLLEWAKSESTGCMDRALGAMLGLVIGDWVGCPLEFLTAVDEPASSRWSHDAFQVENPNTNEQERGSLQPGQWTDDTSMSLCLADSLIACRGFDGADIRLRFWNWHAEGYNNTFRFDSKGSTKMPEKPPRSSFGLGYNIAKSLIALEPGSEITPQFINPGSNDSGNGGLMRLAPIPIFFASHGPDEVMDAAALSSLTTHPGPLATETARCLAWLEHRTINSAPEARADGARAFLCAACDEYAEMLSKRASVADDGDAGSAEVSEALQELRSLLLSTKPDDGTESCWNWRSPASSFSVMKALKARGSKYNGHPVSPPYFGSYCMDALAIALHAVAVTSNFHHAIERAVNFLGDADTVGAIAGQIAGAFYGYAAIDPRYLAPIQQWDHDEIACRAVLCFMLGRESQKANEGGPEPSIKPPPENTLEMRVTTKKSPGFYASSARRLLSNEEGEPAEHLRISGLGEAVGVAVAAAAQVEANDLGTITRVQTAYPTMDSGRGCAQILIDLKKK